MEKRTHDDLVDIVVEMYKAMPQKFREDKEINLIFEDMSSYKENRNTNRQPEVSFETVRKDVQFFIQNAYVQNFIEPNKIISKKERSGWRFTANKLISQIIAYSSHPVHSKQALKLYEELYELFCYASGHRVFVSPKPFKTLKMKQPVFFKHIILWKKRLQNPQEWIAEALDLMLENDTSSETLNSRLIKAFIEVLDNAPLKEQMIEIAKASVSEIREKSLDDLTSEEKSKNNILVELISKALIKLGEKKAAKRYVKKNYFEF